MCLSRALLVCLMTLLVHGSLHAGPLHLWSHRFGDTDDDYSFGIAVDGSGNVIVTGWFDGTVDFGGGPLVSVGGVDLFVAKYDPSGAHLWSQRFGETWSQGFAVAVDGSDNVIVTGGFLGRLDLGGGRLESAGIDDIFVAKFDASGAHQWSHRFGAAHWDWGQGVATDSSGNVILTGFFRETVDFGGGPLVSPGHRSIFVAKYDSSGAHVWSQRFGDSGSEGIGVAVDGSDNVIVTGSFTGNVDFGGGPLASSGVNDIFVAKLQANGVHQWSQRFGDTENDVGFAVAIDGSDNVLLTGYFAGSVDFGGGPLDWSGCWGGNCWPDNFVAKFLANGGHLWSQSFGAKENGEVGQGIAVDASDNVIVTGVFAGTVDFGGGPIVSAGNDDIFLAKYDASGVHRWSQGFGGLSDDAGYAVAVDADGNSIATGYFQNSVDFGGGDLSSAGSNDIYVAKFGEDPTNTLRTGAYESNALAINAHPNPSHSGTTLMLQSPSARTVRALIVDPRGRLVRNIGATHLDPGANQLYWDGTDNAGRPVGAGVYFAVVQPEGPIAVRKVVIAR